MLLLDHESNNYVLLVFLRLVKQDYKKYTPTTSKKADEDGSIDEERDKGSAHSERQDSQKSTRNRQRWWLYLIMSRNPSLIPLRWHNIVVGHHGFVFFQNKQWTSMWTKTFAEIKGGRLLLYGKTEARHQRKSVSQHAEEQGDYALLWAKQHVDNDHEIWKEEDHRALLHVLNTFEPTVFLTASFKAVQNTVLGAVFEQRCRASRVPSNLIDKVLAASSKSGFPTYPSVDNAQVRAQATSLSLAGAFFNDISTQDVPHSLAVCSGRHVIKLSFATGADMIAWQETLLATDSFDATRCSYASNDAVSIGIAAVGTAVAASAVFLHDEW